VVKKKPLREKRCPWLKGDMLTTGGTAEKIRKLYLGGGALQKSRVEKSKEWDWNQKERPASPHNTGTALVQKREKNNEKGWRNSDLNDSRVWNRIKEGFPWEVFLGVGGFARGNIYGTSQAGGYGPVICHRSGDWPEKGRGQRLGFGTEGCKNGSGQENSAAQQ